MSLIDEAQPSRSIVPDKDLPMETAKNVIRVLLVSFSEEDLGTLKHILRASKWSLYVASEAPLALLQLKQAPAISLVICDSDVLRGTWRDLLENLSRMPVPPLLILASRVADDRLWAEALNLGAYDVLCKPFETAEVIRSLSLGWLHRSPD